MIIYEDSYRNENFYNHDENLNEYSTDSNRIPPFGNFPQPPNNPGINNPSMKLGKPPSYIPSKNDPGVQSFNSSKSKGVSTKAVSPNAISFCLYKFTYIWEVSGRSYWIYLITVDKVSISGFRWMGFNWGYFGIDLKKIDSFICYRSNSSNEDCTGYCYKNPNDTFRENIKTEFSNEGVKNIYSRVLSVVDIPEYKEDVFIENIGSIDGRTIESKIPCTKTRTVSYKITLEVSYPENISNSLKEQINLAARDSSIDAYEMLTSIRSQERYIYPLAIENSSSDLISKSLSYFSKKFSSQIRSLPNWKELSRRIHYSIRHEQVPGNWNIQNMSNINKY
ncbi:MAG: hypothetical protein E6940_06930 [Clostridium septicum]|uniref:hypothetical protein n=1 Tax=Clostridium septicum TaxID=1504 RepID=UPI00259095FB|nr:hypothetical protein [Clostridium septicum]MDU1313781.1 hypothetical protein [Clostridium septicum]